MMDDKVNNQWAVRPNKRKRPAAKTMARDMSKKAAIANKLTDPGNASSISDQPPTQSATRISAPATAAAPPAKEPTPSLMEELPKDATVIILDASGAGASTEQGSSTTEAPTEPIVTSEEERPLPDCSAEKSTRVATNFEASRPSLQLNPPIASVAPESATDPTIAMRAAAAELDDFVAQQLREEEEEEEGQLREEEGEEEEEEGQLESLQDPPMSSMDIRQLANDLDAESLESSTPGISTPESSLASRRDFPSAPQESTAQPPAWRGPATHSGPPEGDASSDSQCSAPAAATEVTDSNQSSETASSGVRTAVAREQPPSRSSSTSSHPDQEEMMWAYAKGAGINDNDTSTTSDSEPMNLTAAVKNGPVAMKSSSRHWEITKSFQRPPKKPKTRRGRKKKMTQQNKNRETPGTAESEALAATLMAVPLETSEFKDRRLKVGTTVYAVYPGKNPDNENYHWGDITEKRKLQGNTWIYDVLFHDGDRLEKMISSQYILRMDDFFKIHFIEPYPKSCMPGEKYLKDYYKSGAMTPKELLAYACTICSQCKKKECGACSACEQNQFSASRPGHQCCYQKACGNIVVARKAQKAEGLLPDNWMFYFDDVKKNPTNGGLCLLPESEAVRVPPNKKFVFNTYDSFEIAAAKFPEFRGFDAGAFYIHVGMGGIARKSQPETSRKRCDCYNCSREEGCNKCDRCAVEKPCVRRICCRKPESEKAFQAPFFPPEWKYFFDPSKYLDKSKKSHASPPELKLDGLVLKSPTGELFYSAEEAHRSAKLAENPTEQIELFYQRLGLACDKSDDEERQDQSLQGSADEDPPHEAMGKVARPVSYQEQEAEAAAMEILANTSASSAHSSAVEEPHSMGVLHAPSANLRRNHQDSSQESENENENEILEDQEAIVEETEAISMAIPENPSASADASIGDGSRPMDVTPAPSADLCQDKPHTSRESENENRNELLDDDPRQEANVEDSEAIPMEILENPPPSADASIVDESRQMDDSPAPSAYSRNHQREISRERENRNRNEILNDHSHHRDIAEAAQSIPTEILASCSASVHSSIADGPPPMGVTNTSLADLRRRKCKACYFCRMPGDCGACKACVQNKTRTKLFKDACLQRICLEIPDEERRQEADGFPKARDHPDKPWMFSFRKSNSIVAPGMDPVLAGLSLISPAGLVFKSVEAAQSRCPNQLLGLELVDFYKQIGVRVLEDLPSHPLLGQGFMNEWINMNGERRCIHGTVTKAAYDIAEGSHKFTVRYGKLRESIADTTGTALSIPAEDEFTEGRAWGGCLAYEAMMVSSSNERKLALHHDTSYSETWLVPTMYDRRMVGARIGGERVRLPRVLLQHKLFHLSFAVKPSTIPNAGYGVFLSCQAWETATHVPEYFELPAGHLLDFGIYAPLRPEDRRSDHEFVIKNFVHNFKPQEYSFDTQASHKTNDIFDITDDYSGLLHFEAKRHVTPYVNEIASADAVANVHAKYDCEGGLHYLLGHEREDQGSFRLKIGEEREIFIDYGARYEDVRLRQGYPRTAVAPAEARRLMREDELEYLREVDSYTGNEVKSTVRIFSRALDHKSILGLDAIERSILVLLLLKDRAKKIYIEFEGVGDDDSVCDNGGRDTDAILEVSRTCTHLIKRFVDIWGNKTELHTLLNEEGSIYRAGLELVFTKSELDSPAINFMERICRD